MAKLTDNTVKNWKAMDRRQEIPDTLMPGLYFIVRPTGSKGWQVRYRAKGTHRRMTLGKYPLLSLADAREKARAALLAAQEGDDPAADQREKKTGKPEQQEDRDKIATLVEQFAKSHLSTLRRGGEVHSALLRYVVSQWGDRDADTITKRDVIDLLDGIKDEGKATTANRIRAHLSKFFGWLVERDVLQASPVVGVKPLTKENKRDRVLSDDEVRWFWRACDRLGDPWGPLGKMLLLTGQRRGEVVGMTADEVRGDEWHLSGDRTKNGRAHTVPLSPPALALVGRAGRVSDTYIFSAQGGELSGFAKGHGHIVRAMKQVAEEERGEPVEIPHWTLHDLRRTTATGLARLGIPVRVTEAVLNHVSGTGGGIVEVYQRHDYADEKRQALEAWARLVNEIVEGGAENVVRIGAQAYWAEL